MLAVRHQRNEITGASECGDVITAAPAVLHEASICSWSSAIFGLVHYGDADLVASLVERLGCVRIPLSESIAIGDVDVLDVELNPPVVVRFAESHHRLDRPLLRDRIAEESTQAGLLKSFVREEWHQLDVVLFRETRDAAVERAPHDAEAVDYVDLGRKHRDLVDVIHQAGVAVFAIHIVEEALACSLRSSVSREDYRCEQGQRTAANHSDLTC